jgi:ribosomal-protein-serine acetyltransferase
MTGQENERPNELITLAPVTLRRFRADDLDALFQAVTESLGHLRPWMPWAAADYSLAAAEEYLAGSVKSWNEGTEYNYAIMTAIPGGLALAGAAGLMARIGPGGLEIGYWVHRAYARRGLATAATAALVEQAFRLPGVDRVEIVHDELNVASAGIPRKLGFTEVGRRPLDPPLPEGMGIGVVWRLTRQALTR